MQLLALPNDLLHQIFSLVTPPLPVPTSTTSFLPEALLARGDGQRQEDWATIGSLMLVSKAIKVGYISLCNRA